MGREQGAVAEVHSKLACMKSPGLGPAPSLALSPLRPETQQGGLLCPPPKAGPERSRGVWEAGLNTEPSFIYIKDLG